MNRDDKKSFVAEMKDLAEKSEIIVVVHNKGLTVAEVSALRAAALKEGVKIRVTKNKLTKIALAETKSAPLADMLTGPTMLALSEDPVAAAKVTAKFAEDNKKLELVAAAMGSEILGVEKVKTLAKLPSLDELRARIISIIQTPATRIAGVAAAPAGQLARVIGAYANKEKAA